MFNVNILPLNIQSKCEKEVHAVFLLKIGVSFTVYLFLLQKILNYFQYKLMHRILIANSFLYKCGLTEIELCTFSTKIKESLFHIFLGM